MYHVLLTNRYLTTRVIPFIAVAAVALCVALVIIVVSVMTGFLNMVKSSGRTLMGDVVVSMPVHGIPYYEELIDRIKALPGVEAASPVADSWGLLQMPYPEGRAKYTETVQIWAVEPESFAKVTGFADILHWRSLTGDELDALGPLDFRRDLHEQLGADGLRQLMESGVRLRDAEGNPGIVLGIHVSEANERQHDGSYLPAGGGFWFMPGRQVTLTVLPIIAGATVEPESAIISIVNEFVSGVYLIDDKRVIMPLDLGQKLLHLDQQQLVSRTQTDPATGLPLVLGEDPAKATMILIRGKEGVSPEELSQAVRLVYDTFADDAATDDSKLIKPPHRATIGSGVFIQTWEEQQASFIGPIEKERELMRTLFSLVYIVCAGLILSIFWAIVYEKTRDIGILRSIGASRLGIIAIFLRYGLVIGVIGAIAGLGLGYLVVKNINHIHTALGNPPRWLAYSLMAGGIAFAIWLLVHMIRRERLLPIVLSGMLAIVLLLCGVGVLTVRAAGGIVIWDPAVYYFTKIPNYVDYNTAIITMIGAVVFSLIGAVLPATKAADTDPVQALRYE
jgi:lipoprotein-releasing system permease protein